MPAARCLIALLLVGCAAEAGAAAAAADASLAWPQYRGPNRNGISPEKGLFTNLKDGAQQMWKASLGTGFTSIAVANGMVFACGNTADQDTLFAFDAESGAPVWKYTYPAKLDPNQYEGGPNATPTVAGSAIYGFSKEGFAYCLEAKTGKELWKKNIAQEVGGERPAWGFSGSPTIEGGALYLNVGKYGCCLERTTGKVVWKSASDKAGYSTPLPYPAGKPTSLLIFNNAALASIDPASGKMLWEEPWTTSYGVNASDPVIFGQRIFISTGYDYGCALLDVSSGKPTEVWRNKAMRNHFNTGVLIDSCLYGFDDSTLKCIDLETGIQKWEQGGLGKGSLSAAEGKLVVLSDKGELVIADASPAGFKELARTQVLTGKCWTSPAIANHKIYCRNAKGTLVCLTVK
jgi:outer membrane protein assembly factor BamB